MTAITDTYTGGIVRPLTLDGVDIGVMPSSLSVRPTIHRTRVNTADAASRSFGPLVGDGFPDKIVSYSFSLPFDTIRGATRRQMMLAMARGGYRKLAIWQSEIHSYTLRAGQQTLRLPKFRQNAGQVFAGLIYEGVAINTDAAPFSATLNGTPLTVNYITGPTISGSDIPAAGALTLPALPLVSGAYRDYVQFQIGTTPVKGDELLIEFFPVYVTELTEASIEYPQSIAESRSYVFTER